MNNNIHYLFTDPWILSKKQIVKDSPPKYICLTGNSGVGKSTLLRGIGSKLYEMDNATIAIDEKAIHHPFLQSLFTETGNYGFLIQVNFMIQRALLIKAWIERGYNLIMERSHLEDTIFIEFMYKKGYITNDDHDAYLALWEVIKNHIPEPDVIIFIDYPPEFSISNLNNDELKGIRPREFPDNEEKNNWIHGWHAEYIKLISNLSVNYKNKIIRCNEDHPADTVIRQVFDRL